MHDTAHNPHHGPQPEVAVRADNEFLTISRHPKDSETPQDDSHPIHEGGYGWVCVVCTFLMNAHTWGINSAYGVFLSYYLSSDVFPGTTALEYAFVGGLSISCATLVSPLATYLDRRISTQLVLSIGTVLETLSLITTSFVTKNWQLFLSQGVCFGLGMGFCFCGSVGIVSHWFTKRRSLVNGITAAGSGTGGLIYSLAVGHMIPTVGFPWAMRIISIISFAINLACANLLRVPSFSRSNMRQTPIFSMTLLRRPDYLTFLLWAFLSALGYIALLFSLSSYAVAVGFTHDQASLASALLNLGQAIGRPSVGLLSDYLGRINVASGASTLAGILCLVVWVFAESLVVLYFFAIAVGLFAGTLFAAAAPLAAEVVGIEDLSAALGILWLVICPPTAVAEAIAVQLRDSEATPKPYLRVQLFTGIMYLGAGGCLFMLRVLMYGYGSKSRGGNEKGAR
ncbi:major facilitator superfamily domain-containing protein [Aspergillus caelatus]|uniref:Major facilitator superfamily domain-containing protein n=1 Tax=Aspergillus caelatus TaxID=61420 RepID=A0A5N7A155_9EURO|nr:major facilitator superfamily domain-containing protein [Aspergillus caelatus]KAE8363587.1 major facilitator superfamily domain-containing protein [Aspergillus caelatus]